MGSCYVERGGGKTRAEKIKKRFNKAVKNEGDWIGCALCCTEMLLF